MTIFKANRKFPNPITVTDDSRSHTLALQQIIEALNVGQRRTREINSSYVRVGELVDMGLIEIVGNQLKLTNVGQAVAGGAGATALVDLTDVGLYQPRDNDVLTYRSGLWMSESPAALSGIPYTEQNTNFTAVSNHAYLLSADDVVVTLPSNPAEHDYVIVTSLGYVAGCSIDPNGHQIMGFADALDLDGAVFTVKLIYIDSSAGDWIISL